MRVVIAPQEFKGSLTAVEAAAAIQAGVASVYPDAVIDSAPVADGGPGTVEAIVHAARGRTSIARVDGPLGDPVDARWGRIDEGRTAVIEMAAASGLTLLRSGPAGSAPGIDLRHWSVESATHSMPASNAS